MNNGKNTSKGITLIALVITIIVMLILVGVTISIALNGGLFGYAKNAKDQTKAAVDSDNKLASGRIKIGDTWYDSPQDYVDNIPSQDQSDTSISTDSNKIDYPVSDKIEFYYVDNGDGTASITSIKSLNTSKGTLLGTYLWEFYLNTETLVIPAKTPEGKRVVEVRMSEPLFTGKWGCEGIVKDVKTIVFNSGIQKINGSTKDFATFNAVTKVIIPDTVTEISTDAFSHINCNFTISFPLGANKALQIPENKWGATAIETK